ncbi:signal peptidase I [Rhodococcus hoagii]|nr:signal peptidase I [Prescottella equi]
MVLAVVFAVLALTVLVPAPTGATPYPVLTGSMCPTYRLGTVLVVREQGSESLRVGDSITFEWDPGSSTTVTHRSSRWAHPARRAPFTTQGDANPAPDPAAVTSTQIRGKVWYAIPYGGYAKKLLAAALLLYAVIMLVSPALTTTRARIKSRTATEQGWPTRDRPRLLAHNMHSVT